jgi:hypothetical protein
LPVWAALEHQIAATDRPIDRLLYGLMEELTETEAKTRRKRVITNGKRPLQTAQDFPRLFTGYVT